MAISKLVNSSWISSNSAAVPEFEQSLCEWFHQPSETCLATSNGTTAIELALKALKLPAASKVVVPDVTFAATINAVLNCGLTPVILPVDSNYQYCSETFFHYIKNNNINCVIFVHLYGCNCSPKSQLDFLKKDRIPTIADCAEALDIFHSSGLHPSDYTACTFSFFANKLITTGEGGCVIFSNLNLAKEARIYRNHGMSSKHRYWHTHTGMNCRMTGMQAALGISQLTRVDEFIARRQQIFSLYLNSLSLSSYFRVWNPPNICCIWLVNIELSNPFSDSTLLHNLSLHLRENNIDTRNCFYPLSQMPIYKDFACSSLFTTNEGFSLTSFPLLSLPTFTDLSDHQLNIICDSIFSFESSL